jgi:hypothetical protein
MKETILLKVGICIIFNSLIIVLKVFSNKDEIRTMRVDLSTYQQEISLLKDDNNKWKDRFQTVLKKYGVSISLIIIYL